MTQVSVSIASARFLHSNVQVSIKRTSFFLVFQLKDKNVVQVFTLKWRKYPCFGTRFGQRFFHLFSRSEQHDAMTKIFTLQYTSATLQVYYCRLWCELRVKRRHCSKLSIDTNLYKLYKHTTTKRRTKKKKRSITMILTLWSRRWFYLEILCSQAFPFPSDE